MRANVRLRLAVIVAAVIAALVAAPSTSFADHGCQAGTSWDNITQSCR